MGRILMSLIDIFRTGPTAEEKAEAKAFKNTLKFGHDIGSVYEQAVHKHDIAWEQLKQANKTAIAAIIKQRKIKTINKIGYWSEVKIRRHYECDNSPVGFCVTMYEFGTDNPKRNKKVNCFYCNKEY